MNKLPDMCYSVLESTNELILIKRGEMGFFPQRPENAPWSADNMDILNERLGVTKGQAEAMKNGSMFGWDTPVANPDNYDEEGNWIESK